MAQSHPTRYLGSHAVIDWVSGTYHQSTSPTPSYIRVLAMWRKYRVNGTTFRVKLVVGSTGHERLVVRGTDC